MKTRIELSKVLIIFALVLFTDCSKKDKDRYHGIDTIDNQLYGTQTYYALGFSFELGPTSSTLEAPSPDITIHLSTDLGGNITGQYFNTPNLIESFSFIGTFGSAAEAQDQFDSLLEVGTRTWELSASGVEENQLWLFKTSDGNYVKIRTIELRTDNSVYPPYVEIKFEWRMQPGGATTFSS
jgi:hypothetical protein